jgi:hypothetical protein
MGLRNTQKENFYAQNDIGVRKDPSSNWVVEEWNG